MPSLDDALASGDAILFTGAGFSAEARDRAGRAVPTTGEMTRDLWRMCFGDAPPDDSSLNDLYDVALATRRDELDAYLRDRLIVAADGLADHYEAWFAAPWRRIYTLNVDTLAIAVAERFRLPRALAVISALGAPPREPGGAVEVVHLNGLVLDGPERMMFSTFQYAARVCQGDDEYRRLADDLLRWPCVFVGTTLDEIVLWQHVELQRRRTNTDARPLSFLVAPSLTQARRALLARIGVAWIESTAREIAARIR